ncbi:MAG: YlxR family protein [Chloroflexota bacterium]|nr:YlxR family protein [Chloroflexota bacterium]
MTDSPRRHKHVPERTCVACKQKKAKWELVRIVHTPQKTLEIDLRGKKAGRGVYLCKKEECWDLALKKRFLGHALKTEITLEQRAELVSYGKALLTAAEEIEMSHQP